MPLRRHDRVACLHTSVRIARRKRGVQLVLPFDEHELQQAVLAPVSARAGQGHPKERRTIDHGALKVDAVVIQEYVKFALSVRDLGHEERRTPDPVEEVPCAELPTRTISAT